MKKIISLGVVIGGITPLSALAASSNAFSILVTINQLLNWIIPVLISLAVIYFIWGVIQYTVSTDEETKKGARSKIISGLIGLFVIVAFWGIINLVTRTFDVGSEITPPLPCVPGPGVDCF